MVALTLVFFAVAQMGLLFLAGALALGAHVPVPGVRDVAEGTDARAVKLYKYSITYLSGLFALIVLDVAIFLPGHEARRRGRAAAVTLLLWCGASHAVHRDRHGDRRASTSLADVDGSRSARPMDGARPSRRSLTLPRRGLPGPAPAGAPALAEPVRSPTASRTAATAWSSSRTHRSADGIGRDQPF